MFDQITDHSIGGITSHVTMDKTYSSQGGHSLRTNPTRQDWNSFFVLFAKSLRILKIWFVPKSATYSLEVDAIMFTNNLEGYNIQTDKQHESSCQKLVPYYFFTLQ